MRTQLHKNYKRQGNIAEIQFKFLCISLVILLKHILNLNRCILFYI